MDDFWEKLLNFLIEDFFMYYVCENIVNSLFNYLYCFIVYFFNDKYFFID